MTNLSTILTILLTTAALYEFVVWGIKQDLEIVIGFILLGAAVLVYWIPRVQKRQQIPLPDKSIIIPIAVVIILIIVIAILDTP